MAQYFTIRQKCRHLDILRAHAPIYKVTQYGVNVLCLSSQRGEIKYGQLKFLAHDYSNIAFKMYL